VREVIEKALAGLDVVIDRDHVLVAGVLPDVEEPEVAAGGRPAGNEVVVGPHHLSLEGEVEDLHTRPHGRDRRVRVADDVDRRLFGNSAEAFRGHGAARGDHNGTLRSTHAG
jgi:hypothetical protein